MTTATTIINDNHHTTTIINDDRHNHINESGVDILQVRTVA